MLTFVERLQNDCRTALKAHDDVVVGTLRMLLAAIKNAEIAGKRTTMSDEAIVSVVQREVKKRKEALELYRQGGSNDRAAREQAELDVLLRYMPEQMDAAGIDAVVAGAIATLSPSGPADFGKVMGSVMKELKGRANGTAVQAAVKNALQRITT